MITLLFCLLVLEIIFVIEILNKEALEEFIEVFYGRLKEILKGEF